LRHISRQSQNFNITNVDEFEYAFNKARYNKSHKSTVNGKTYKIKQIGNAFWYGAIVGHKGIGIYAPNKTYVLIVTHNENMGLLEFARYFENLKHKFEAHRAEIRAEFVNDKNICFVGGIDSDTSVSNNSSIPESISDLFYFISFSIYCRFMGFIVSSLIESIFKFINVRNIEIL
jgi:hypothetical protein